MKKSKTQANGFTIVELLIVIVVIAILAAITIVSYGSIQKSAKVSSVSTQLKQTATKIENYKTINGDYPSDLSSIPEITPGNSMTQLYFPLDGNKQYCVQVTLPPITYSITSTNPTPQEGECEAANTPQTAVYTATGDGGGFKLTTNEKWDEITFSWDAYPGAINYELQVNRGDDVWIYVNKTNGSSSDGSWGCANASTRANCSARITTTSVSWTSDFIRPVNTTQVMAYRLSPVTSAGKQPHYSLSLEAQTQDRTKVAGLSVRPISNSDFNQYVVSWNPVTSSNVPNPVIQLQVNRGNGTWVYVDKTVGDETDGSYNCANASTRPQCSGQIAIGVDSLTLTDPFSRIADLNSPYTYRIRLSSNTVSGVVSGWNEFTHTLSPTSTLNKPSNPTASPAGNWAGVNIKWTNTTSQNVFNPKVQIQINRGNDTWVLVNKTDGSSSDGSWGCANASTRANCSGQIDATHESISWASSYAFPGAGQTFQYRIRYYSTTVANYSSDWVTFSLSR